MVKPKTVAEMISSPSEQVPSAERMDEALALWQKNEGWRVGARGEWLYWNTTDHGFRSFIAALDAQSAERTRVLEQQLYHSITERAIIQTKLDIARAEVEKMREAVVIQIQAEAADTEDGETLEALNRVMDRVRALPIESPSR